MIYLTGDCHGDFHRFARRQREKLSVEPGEGDQVIVCGDLGLLWARDRELTYNLKWLSKLPFTLLWVQGNHENYDLIAEYPMEQWNGGKVRHILRDKIILLERGQIFRIEGKRFFTFGGASSHDIQGGILDRNSPTYAKDKESQSKRPVLPCPECVLVGTGTALRGGDAGGKRESVQGRLCGGLCHHALSVRPYAGSVGSLFWNSRREQNV